MSDGVKKPWLSKTLWINALVAVSALAIPSMSAWLTGHATEVMTGLAGMNFLLRMITKDKISLGE